jgi:hypothetical protein
MYARLGFSVAAHVDPDVLIVDEVLSVGDSLFQRKCIERMQEVLRNGAAVLFVSHNLKIVAEFCHRCLLLEKGRTLAVGPSQQVISKYLQQDSSVQGREANPGPVVISSVKIRNEEGECIHFQSGQKAWVDVELIAHAHCKNVSITLYMLSDTFVEVFETSTDRLGYDAVDLDQGDNYRCTFELDLNLADGTFYPSILIYRYDIQATYDTWEPAATIYVSSERNVRGIVQCFPRVIQHEIQKASDETMTEKVRGAIGNGERRSV